jgi:hypothetical protein
MPLDRIQLRPRRIAWRKHRCLQAEHLRRESDRTAVVTRGRGDHLGSRWQTTQRIQSAANLE